ncbi:MAG: hypothetical protein ACP5NC_07805, partial [Nitrososphaeria archaeon]
WPPKREELELAEREIPDKVVNQLVASGSVEEAIKYINNVTYKWNSYPILYITSDYRYTMEQLKKVLDI